MLFAYFNYPNSRVVVHKDRECGNIQQMKKEDQRYVQINPSSFSHEIEYFVNKKHQFASSSEYNDMWVEIDFKNELFEMSVLHFIHSLLASRYKVFRETHPAIHCGA